jgi:hypothetical protein
VGRAPGVAAFGACVVRHGSGLTRTRDAARGAGLGCPIRSNVKQSHQRDLRKSRDTGQSGVRPSYARRRGGPSDTPPLRCARRRVAVLANNTGALSPGLGLKLAPKAPNSGSAGRAGRPEAAARSRAASRLRPKAPPKGPAHRPRPVAACRTCVPWSQTAPWWGGPPRGASLQGERVHKGPDLQGWGVQIIMGTRPMSQWASRVHQQRLEGYRASFGACGAPELGSMAEGVILGCILVRGILGSGLMIP